MRKSNTFVALLLFLVLAGIAALLIFRSYPQKQNQLTVKRVGILNLGSYPLMDTITEECEKSLLAEKNIKILPVVLNANFQQEILLRYARQLVSDPYDVLVAVTTPAAQVLIAENKGRTPLVFTFVSTPSEIGVRDSNSLHNVTGLADTVPVEMNLRIARELVGSGALGYIVNDGEASAAQTYREAAQEAQRLGLSLRKLSISSQNDVRSVAQLALPAVQGFMVGPDSVATSAIDALVGVANGRHLPVICSDPVSVQRGCLVAVAPNYAGMGRKTAEYVLDILRGKSPNSLPVVYFKDYRTYVNQETLRTLGVKLPEPLPASEVVRYAEAAD